MKKIFPYFFALALVAGLTLEVQSQTGNNSLHVLKFHSLSGEARLNGLYREQERIGRDFSDYQKSSYLTGGLSLKTKCSIIHENFLELDFDAGYTPETRKDNYIIIPDQSEVRTVKKLIVNALFLKKKKVNINLFADYSDSYSARENLTDVWSVNKHMGGSLAYNNKIVPFSVDFHSRKWDEEEIRTRRKYQMDQQIFGARMSKSFSKRDLTELRYSHDANVNLNQNMFRVANTNDNFDFLNTVSLDSKKRYNLNTVVSNYTQRGNTDWSRFQAGEMINMQLPANLAFSSNYNFFNIRQKSINIVQHGINTRIEHKLFNSLRSTVYFDVNTTNHAIYREFNTKKGFELDYSKSIPKGQFQISYKYESYHQNYHSDPVSLAVINEQYLLSDMKINLLKLPSVDPTSVIIRDITGIIVFERELDYILQDRGNYIEIRRIPGGLIADNSTVLIDYTAMQPGTYHFDSNTHVINSAVYLFKNVFLLNYRFSMQDYSNLEGTEFVTLNYFTQNLIGCRLDFGFLNAGVEYEDYKSSILPYKKTRYYLNLQKNIGKNLIAMLNGNMQNFIMLDEPLPKYQKYLDLNGKITCSLFGQTKLNLNVMYRNQSGRGIDLNLLTAKAEVTSVFSHLFLAVGVEVYRRNYIGEVINFKGTYVRISRKF